MVDIIIPVWNELDLTRMCIDSIKKHTGIPYRLIIIDNGSEKETEEYLRSLEKEKEINVMLIRNEANLGYIKAVNQGLRISNAEYVCILNNDTVVTDGWLEKMIKFAERHRSVGLINPVFNSKKEALESLKKLDDIAKNYEKFEDEYFELHGCVGTCMLIKREVIEKIGLFDEEYGLGYFEDNDYSRRAQQAGYKCVKLMNTFVWHYVTASFNKIGEKKQIIERNRRRYYERWGEEIVIIYPFPEPLPMERARSIQYINTCLSLARNGVLVYMLIPRGSSDRRSLTKYYGVVDHGNINIKYIPSIRFDIDGKLRVNINYIFYVLCLLKILKIKRNKKRKDPEKKIAVLVRHPKLAYFLSRFRGMIDLKMIYEVHEIFNVTSSKDKEKLFSLESKIFDRMDGFITITRNLESELRVNYSVRKPICTIPDGVDLEAFADIKASCMKRGDGYVIYTGQSYPWKGVDTLLRASNFIKARILLVGVNGDDMRKMKDIIRDFPEEKIEYTGWVPPSKVREYLRNASVAVIPNKRETISAYYTSPLKMFEYMAAGIPIVASDLPSIREVLKHEENALLVEPDNPEMFAEAVNRLLLDRSLAERLSSNAQELVRRYSWNERGKRIKEFILKEIYGREVT